MAWRPIRPGKTTSRYRVLAASRIGLFCPGLTLFPCTGVLSSKVLCFTVRLRLVHEGTSQRASVATVPLVGEGWCGLEGYIVLVGGLLL